MYNEDCGFPSECRPVKCSMLVPASWQNISMREAQIRGTIPQMLEAPSRNGQPGGSEDEPQRLEASTRPFLMHFGEALLKFPGGC